MITDRQILLIQAVSDLRSLREEQEAGLYKKNPGAFNKAWAKIAEKVEKLESVETLEEKAERIRQEADYEEPGNVQEKIMSPKDEEHYYQEQGRL